MHVDTGVGGNGLNVGIATSGLANYSSDPAVSTPSGHYWHAIDSRGYFTSNTVYASNSTGFLIGDVIGVAIDLDSATNTITYTKNGTTVGSAQDLESGQTWFPHVKSSSYTNTPRILNFGQNATFSGGSLNTSLKSRGVNPAVTYADEQGNGSFQFEVPSNCLCISSPDPESHFAEVGSCGKSINFTFG